METDSAYLGDFCNRRSIKCSRSDDPLGRCQNCSDFDVPCTFDRPAKRRGVKVGTRANARDSPAAKPVVDHISTGRHAAAARLSVSSTSRSSQLADLTPRPSLTGDPWTFFNTGWSTPEGYDDDGALRNSWKAFAISCDRQIRNLVEVYFEIVYPM